MYEESSLSLFDWIIFGVSMAISVCIGLLFVNKNKTFVDYATGGNGQSLLTISMSMATAYCSGLTIIGNPTELYLNGSSFTVAMAATLIAWPISSFVILPVFQRSQTISLFEYLESRYSPSVRRLVSSLYIIESILYSSVTLFLPSLSLNAILGIPQSISIGLVGCICVTYSTFAGIKGITWANMYHSILLILAIVSILLFGTHQIGGFSKLFKETFMNERLSLGEGFFNFDFNTRHSIFNIIFGYSLVRLFLHGTSQTQIQYALSLPSLRQAQLSQLISSLIYVLIQISASSIGLLFYINYKNCDPFLSGQLERKDEIVLHYLSNKLSESVPSIQGLFLAALIGSTFTSISLFQHSCSAMIVEDFIRPIFHSNKRKLCDNLAAKLGKFIALLLGFSCIGLTFQMHRAGYLIQASTNIFTLFGIPILMSFLLGILTQFINSSGVIAGILCSFCFGIYAILMKVFYGDLLDTTLDLSTKNCPFINSTNQQIDIFEFRSNSSSDIIDKIDSLNYLEEIIANLSYLWLPAFMAFVSIVFSSIVSIASGGLDQIVDEHYLSTVFCKQKPNKLSHHSEDIQSKLTKEQMIQN